MSSSISPLAHLAVDSRTWKAALALPAMGTFSAGMSAASSVVSLAVDSRPGGASRASLTALVAKNVLNFLGAALTTRLLGHGFDSFELTSQPSSQTAFVGLQLLMALVSSGTGAILKKKLLPKQYQGGWVKTLALEGIISPPLYMIACFYAKDSLKPTLPLAPQKTLSERLYENLSTVCLSALTSATLHTTATLGALHLLNSSHKAEASPSSSWNLFKSKKETKLVSESSLLSKSVVVGLSSFLSSLCISFVAKQCGEAALYGSMGGLALSTLMNLVLLSKKRNPLALGAATCLGTLAGISFTSQS